MRLFCLVPALLHPALALTNDSWLYRKAAQDLAHGTYSTIFRTPGYPVFLLLTGGGLGHGIGFSLLAQAVLDGVTACLLAQIAGRIFRSQHAARAAGLAWALCPVAIAISAEIMAESVFAFCLVSALALLVLWRSPLSPWAQGALLAAATLTRPAGALLPLLIWPLCALGSAPEDLRVPPRNVAATLGLYLAVGLAFLSWNHARTGRYLLSTVSDLNVAMYEWPAVRVTETVGWKHYVVGELFKPKPLEERRVEIETHFIHEVQPGTTQVTLWDDIENPTRMASWKNAAAARLASHRGATLAIHAIGALQILRPYPPTKRGGVVLTFLDTLHLLAGLAALAVVARARIRNAGWYALVLGLWSAYVLLLPGYVGLWRLRDPLEPAICLLIGLGYALWKSETGPKLEAAA